MFWQDMSDVTYFKMFEENNGKTVCIYCEKFPHLQQNIQEKRLNN